MVLKTILAFIVTVAFAAAAVFFGMQHTTDSNEIRLHNGEQGTEARGKGFLGGLINKNNADAGNATYPTNTPPPNRAVKVKTITNQERRDIIDILAQQAEQIGIANLEDQAYVDIVDYALRHSMFVEAYTAMKKIEHVELRDTSRGQIAISMARTGQIVEAFEVIDQVETDGLRDVLRLQVIEAVTLPETQNSQVFQRLPRDR